MAATSVPGSVGLARQEVQSDRGQLVLEYPAPGVVVSRVIGHLDLSITRAITEAVDSVHAGSSTHSFKDWSAATGYDTDARMFGTKWLLAHAAPAPTLHILANHRLVAMGVATAALTLTLAKRDLRSYASPESFAAALHAATVAGRAH